MKMKMKNRMLNEMLDEEIEQVWMIELMKKREEKMVQCEMIWLGTIIGCQCESERDWVRCHCLGTILNEKVKEKRNFGAIVWAQIEVKESLMNWVEWLEMKASLMNQFGWVKMELIVWLRIKDENKLDEQRLMI